MKAVIQRVKRASVKVNSKIIGQIGPGLVILLGIGSENIKYKQSLISGENQISKIKKLTERLLNLRIFGDRQDKMNLSVLDIKGEIMAIPQFTLYADCSRGNRPYFGEAAKPEIAKPIFEKFVEELKESGLKVEKGKFRAKMEVELINDGPVTIVLDEKNL